eukprot:9323200-Alexandrium_andersonii.AAC.1
MCIRDSLRTFRRAAQVRAWIAQARPDSLDAAFSLALRDREQCSTGEVEAVYRLFAWARGHAHREK